MKGTFAAILSALLLGALLPAIAVAQDRSGEEIVVRGTKIAPETLAEAAKRVAPDIRANQPLPRFIDPLCISAIGFAPHTADAIEEMIERHATDLGAKIDSPDCRPNALLVVVDDVTTFLREAIKEQPRLVSAASLAAAESQIAEGRAAIVVHNLEPRSKHGARLPVDNTFPGFTGIKPMAVNARINMQGSPSRVSSSQSTAIVSAMLVIDARRLKGATYRQISDYSIMVMLGNAVTRRWETEHTPSILSLFNGEAQQAPTALTTFDEIYLQQLYDMPLNAEAGKLAASVKREFVSMQD